MDTFSGEATITLYPHPWKILSTIKSLLPLEYVLAFKSERIYWAFFIQRDKQEFTNLSAFETCWRKH